MKVVILAGGFGTRLSEETVFKPKPMVEIGGRPILWHIMKIFATYGVDKFVIALGYKSDYIKEYFLNFYAINNDITVDLASGQTTIHEGNQLNWKVHLVDTGLHTMTGGRLKRVCQWLNEDEPFFFTYGDGVANINLDALLEFHRAHNKLATVTTVRPSSRFGNIAFDHERITEFYEKPESGEGWINSGYFVLDTAAIDYIDNDETVWEQDPIRGLVSDNQLMGYRHPGFWSCMDTIKQKQMLEAFWQRPDAPWRIWAS